MSNYDGSLGNVDPKIIKRMKKRLKEEEINKKKKPTEKEAKEFSEYLIKYLNDAAIQIFESYLCEHHQDHGLTHGQFIQTCMITYMAEQSVIFDRHNEKVNKKLKKELKNKGTIK